MSSVAMTLPSLVTSRERTHTLTYIHMEVSTYVPLHDQGLSVYYELNSWIELNIVCLICVCVVQEK